MMIGLFLLALAMLGATALAIGGVVMLRKGTDNTRGWLMIAAAVVVIGNVLILTV
jgi:hypothetical protein